MNVIVITDDMEKWDRLVSDILDDRNYLWGCISQTKEIKYYRSPTRPEVVRGNWRIKRFSTNDLIEEHMRGQKAMALIVDKEFMEKIKDKETIKKNFGETFTDDYITQLYAITCNDPCRDNTLEFYLFNQNKCYSSYMNLFEF